MTRVSESWAVRVAAAGGAWVVDEVDDRTRELPSGSACWRRLLLGGSARVSPPLEGICFQIPHGGRIAFQDTLLEGHHGDDDRFALGEQEVPAALQKKEASCPSSPSIFGVLKHSCGGCPQG